MEKPELKVERKKQKEINVLQVDYLPKQRNYRVKSRITAEHDLKVMAGLLSVYFIQVARENCAMSGGQAMQCLIDSVEEGLSFYGDGLMEDAGAQPLIRPENPIIEIVKGRDFFEEIDKHIGEKN